MDGRPVRGVLAHAPRQLGSAAAPWNSFPNERDTTPRYDSPDSSRLNNCGPILRKPFQNLITLLASTLRSLRTTTNFHEVTRHKNGCLLRTLAPAKLRHCVRFLPLISVFLSPKVSIYPKRRASTVEALFETRSPDESLECARRGGWWETGQSLQSQIVSLLLRPPEALQLLILRRVEPY